MSKLRKRRVSVTYHDDREATFEQQHKAGAKEFGWAWIDANQAAVEYGGTRVEVTDVAVKELLSYTILQIMRRLKKSGYLNAPTLPMGEDVSVDT